MSHTLKASVPTLLAIAVLVAGWLNSWATSITTYHSYPNPNPELYERTLAAANLLAASVDVSNPG